MTYPFGAVLLGSYTSLTHSDTPTSGGQTMSESVSKHTLLGGKLHV